MRKLQTLFSTVLLAVVASTLMWAQSGTSTISGTVKDVTGSPIPNTKIKVVNVESGAQLDTVSNEAGLYRASALLPGSYRLEVDAAGFDHLTRGPIALGVSQTLAIDLNLQVGKQTETVTVTEATPLTESQSSNVSQTVNRQMLSGLPLPNRAASSLAAFRSRLVTMRWLRRPSTSTGVSAATRRR